MQEKTVTENTSYLIFSYVGQKFLSFIYFVLVARFLAVEDLGKYTFALGFTTMFAVFIDLGFTQALIREVAKFKEKTEKYLASIFGIKAALSIVVYLLVVLAINILNYPIITKQLVYLSGIVMILDSITLSAWGVLRGIRNLKLEALSVLVNQAIILISGGVILYWHLPIVYMILPFILGSAFSLIFSIYSLHKFLHLKIRLEFDWQVIKYLLSISLAFALVAVFSRIYGNLDSVILSKLKGDSAVAMYSVAMKIPFALQFIPASLAAAIFPAFSHYFVSNPEQLKHTFEKVMRFLIVISLPISFGIACLSKNIILTFYSDKYLDAALPLSILMGGLLFIFLNFPLGSLLNGCNRQFTNTKLVGLTLLFNIILNIILIPRYSFLGAALSFVFSHAFLFFISLIISKQIIDFKLRKTVIVFFKALIASAVMGLFVYYFSDKLSLLINIPIGAIIYFIVLIILRGVDREDSQFLINFLKRKPATSSSYEKDIADNN